MRYRDKAWSWAALLVATICLPACNGRDGSSEVKLRNMTSDEALTDFAAIVAAVKTKYGPLEYKQRRFGLQIDELAAKSRTELAQADSDLADYAVYKRFLANLHDGHVSLTVTQSAGDVRMYGLPIMLTAVEGKAVVESVDKTELVGYEATIAPGDVLSSIDGVDPMSLLPTIKTYETFGNDETDKQLVAYAVRRPSYMLELKPKADMAHLVFTRADGSRYETDLSWHVAPYYAVAHRPFALADSGVLQQMQDIKDNGFTADSALALDAARGESLAVLGQAKPFFATDAVTQRYGFVTVAPDAAHLQRFGLTPEQAAPALKSIYAAMYRYGGKSILLIRQPGYEVDSISNSIKAYQALLSQYEPLVDVLVIDQTNNPGGALDYAVGFVSLFLGGPQPNFVQANHADRTWINVYRQAASDPSLLAGLSSSVIAAPAASQELALRLENRADDMEKAYDAKQWLGPVQPMFTDGNYIYPNKDYAWAKPVLVLADEMAGSCGDIFPMLMKRDGVAKIFGKRTMGLGGNVELVLNLPVSGSELRLTRGLYTTYKADETYKDADFVENNGILPDYPYEQTIADMRAGFVDYVKAFSDKAIQQTRAGAK